jgi:hypothetical protein
MNSTDRPNDGIIFSDDPNDGSTKQNKSIQDISEEYFEEAAEYFAMCERSLEIKENLLQYKKKLTGLKEERPDYDPKELITEKELANQLKKIADSQLDDFNETIWSALSTRILVAFFIQNEKNIFEKVFVFRFYYGFVIIICAII